MDKYKMLFITKLKKTIQEWTELPHVPNDEVYRLLHSLKGTAASIGLEQFSEIAAGKLETIEEYGERVWEPEEWFVVLNEIIAMLPDDTAQEQVNIPSAVKPVYVDEPKMDTAVNYQLKNELILLVDDDIHLLYYFKQQLEKQGFNIQVAVSGEQALRVFYDLKPDCVVLDINLPGKNGFEVIEDIVEKSQLLFIPIILISANELKETRMKAYQLGAADFMTKPLDIEEFVVRVLNRLKQKKALEKMILVDELTGAFNRKFLQIEMSRQMNDFHRIGKSFSIVMADIDFFKKVNDRYGHDVGDEVLRTFSQIIMNKKRASDSFVRFGGGEFILILPNANKRQAQNLMERLLTDFSSVSFPHRDGDFSVTFSAGITELESEHTNIHDLLKEVDDALYMAKENGRKRVELYDSDKKQANPSQKILHIGIVDDDPVIHQILSEHLSRMTIPGVKVKIQEFREGESFLNSEWVQQSGKFLILLDGMMPRMDGLEILYQLKKDRSKRDFTIVMLTGRKSEKDIVRALELGADDYMTKPFSIVELEARVKRWAMRMLGEKTNA